MEAKVNKMWIVKGIAFLFLLAILIPCPHQSFDHKCRTWSKVKILMPQQKTDYPTPRRLLNHLLWYFVMLIFIFCQWSFLHKGWTSTVMCSLFSMQCSVSLSVICPKQLPKLRAIYNAVMMTI